MNHVTLALALIGIGAVASPACESIKVNVVIVLADDLGYGDLGCYGASKIATPHCDRMAKEGRRFIDAHSPSAVCSPTRFGLLTGGYPWRGNRVPRHLHAYEPLVIRDGEPTLARLFQSQGYATACIGKWHLGAQRENPIDWNKPLKPGPNDCGFDYFFGVINSHNQAPFLLAENDRFLGLKPEDRVATRENREQTGGPKLRDEHTLEAQQAEKAAAFIEQNRDRPFFLYYPTAAVHGPLTPGTAWQGKSQAGTYGDYVQEFDSAVGQILDALDRFKLADRTIVVVTSDNGAVKDSALQFGHRCNGPWRGAKTMAYEGGHRVPFLVRWPGKIPTGTTCEETTCHVDLLATLAAAIEVPLASNAGPDSWNLLPAWLGTKTDQPIREATVCVSQNAAVFALRQGPWKLIVPAGNKKSESELYNLIDDPAENQNLAERHPDKVESLAALLARYRQQGGSRPGWRL